LIALLYGHDAVVQGFVRAVYGRHDIEFQGGKSIGVLDGDTLIAGIVFHDWHPEAGTIEVSVASVSARWLQRRTIAAIARYVIEGVGAQLVVLRTSEANTRACRAADALGFMPHRIPRLRGPSEAEIIYTLPVEEWQAGRFAIGGDHQNAQGT